LDVFTDVVEPATVPIVKVPPPPKDCDPAIAGDALTAQRSATIPIKTIVNFIIIASLGKMI
jgi:hypothetical protein